MRPALAFTTAAIAACVTLPVSAAQTPPDLTEVAFVANAEAGTVALVEIASRSIIGVLDINPARAERKGPGATNYAQDTDVSPDGRTIYVSRGYLGDVAAFDLSSAKMLWERSLNTGRADHMTITADGRSLFVSALMDNRVYKLSASTGEINGHVVTGIYPHDVKVSKDGKWLYNSSLGPLGTLPRSASAAPLAEQPGNPFELTIASVETLAVRDRIKLDNAFRPWHFSKDEKLIHAQRSNEHAVVTYDLASRKVVRRLELPVKLFVKSADWDFEAPHHGLALTEDGATLCLAGRASDYAALVSAKDLTLIATIPVGDAPGWSEVADEGRICLIANTRSDELSIISIPKRAEVERLSIGNGPKHITVARIPQSVIAAFKSSRRNRSEAGMGSGSM
jgi:DNA-binding beta-propeller fold protein YncE